MTNTPLSSCCGAEVIPKSPPPHAQYTCSKCFLMCTLASDNKTPAGQGEDLWEADFESLWEASFDCNGNRETFEFERLKEFIRSEIAEAEERGMAMNAKVKNSGRRLYQAGFEDGKKVGYEEGKDS